MNKVTIEITANGWTTKVFLNNEEYSETHVSTVFGSKSVGVFINPDDIGDDLSDCISGVGFDTMKVLKNLKS